MHVKLLKELLDLDKYKTRQTLQNQLNPSESTSQPYKLKETVNPNVVKKPKDSVDRRQNQNIKKMKTKGDKEDDNDISSNLMKTIIDAHEPINLDLQSISDSDISSNTSSYDSFYDTN